MNLLRQLTERLEIGMHFPSLIPRQIRHYWRSTVLVPSDERLGTHFCSFPRTINFKVTNVCNLRCKMCGQWGETGFHFDMSRDELTATLSLQDYKRIISECAPRKPDFYIWGGEPFLYSHILDVIGEIKRQKMFAAVNTNGSHVAQSAERLVEMALDLLIVSVDGIREDHDAVRGRGSYDAAVEGIKAVLRARKQLRSKYPLVALACTITNSNYSRLRLVLDLARELKVDHLDFGFPLFVTEKMGHAYEKSLQQTFQAEARSWKGFLGSAQSRIEMNALANELAEIRSSRNGLPLMFFPDLKEHSQVRQFFQKPGFTFQRACHAPWTHLEVQPNGDVYTCHDFPDLIVGNLRQHSVAEVWNGEKMGKFRRFLREGNLFAICGKCCRLYE